MNGPCRNGSCPKLANLVARIAGTGDRGLCTGCFESLHVLMGDGACDVRSSCVQRCSVRRLDVEPAFIPEWRMRSLRKGYLTDPS